MLTTMIEFTSQSLLKEPHVQAMGFHHGFIRDAPHRGQMFSSLPISCLQLGQSVTAFAINKSFSLD